MEVKEYLSWPRIDLTGNASDMLGQLDRQANAIRTSPGKDGPILLTIASSGGGTGSARAVNTELTVLGQELDLTLVARGFCESSALTVAMAIPLERRFATPGTTFKLHESWRSESPDLTGPLSFRTKQLKRIIREHKNDEKEAQWITGIIAESCGRTYKEVDRAMRRDTVLVGAKAIEFGLISGVFHIDRSVLDGKPLPQ